MKGIYTLSGLFVFAAAFSIDTFAQNRARNGARIGQNTQTASLTSKKTRVTGDWDGDGRDTIGITADPKDRTGNTYYVGSANGGVWKSANTRSRTSSVGLTETVSVGAAQ
jgi:hypothetical protein